MTDNYTSPSPHRLEAELTGTIWDTCLVQGHETDRWHLGLIFEDGECLHLTSDLQIAVTGLLGNRIAEWRGRKLRITIAEEADDTPAF